VRSDFRDRSEDRAEFDERVIDIARVAKVVKGGRRFSFRVTVVAGDNHGNVGLGVGKARGVPDAIKKATERARQAMLPVPLAGTTIPHEVIAKHGGASVLLKPASPGTGVIAVGRAASWRRGARHSDPSSAAPTCSAPTPRSRACASNWWKAGGGAQSPNDLRPFWEQAMAKSADKATTLHHAGAQPDAASARSGPCGPSACAA
jgi:hypothetical protein